MKTLILCAALFGLLSYTLIVLDSAPPLGNCLALLTGCGAAVLIASMSAEGDK